MSDMSGNGTGQGNGDIPAAPVLLRFGAKPALALPPQVPVQKYRAAQSNIPDDKRVRAQLKKAAADHVRQVNAVPPLTLGELREHTSAVLALTGVDLKFKDYVAILVSNAAWHDTVAKIPYERRLLLLPKCLRVEDKCPAPFDEFGLLCKECGLCSIQDLTVEAERLGYAVLVAEGSAIVRSMIETGKIEAVVGVSCLNVLEKSFPHMEAAAIPGVAIPLLQDDCINTTVDLDWVWDLIHLTSKDKTYRLDLDSLKNDVQSWFAPASLDGILGPAEDETSALARRWLAKDGKRWRPYLAACATMALLSDQKDEAPAVTPDLKKLAVAVECFHKASLIHDDIEDGDAQRYGDKTLHEEVGVPVALNAGDFLLGEGYRLIGELTVDPSVRIEMLKLASAGHLSLSRGQGRELLWIRNPAPLGSVEVLDLFRLKTAPAFEVALRLGACLGGADEGTHEVLRRYSESLGIAYQIQDDLEDCREGGESDDLSKGRPSVIVAIAYKRSEEGAEKELMRSLFKPAAAPVNGAVHAVFKSSKAVEKAEELLEAYKEDAIRSLRFLSGPTLKGLLRRVVGKIFGEHLIEGYCSEFEARNAASRAAGAQTPSRGR
ncbi:MAG TPA: polyprenyl synthetase family protein [Planctomycetota bacterium]|nr:polyprenyl synthetase family protein [Planctomycetota bacterium]